jgi:hypothetical protein
MASSRVSTQITWAAAANIVVSANTAQTSDAFTFNAEDWDGELQIWGDVTGSPAAGDVCNVQIAYTTGDVIGGGGDDFATTEFADFAFQLDFVAANTPGEDPASKSIPVRTGAKGFKVIVTCPQAATRNVTIYAMVCTHRPQ